MTTGEIHDLACDLIGPGPEVRTERIDLDHVAALREAIDALPPITVRHIGGRYRLVDGQHRLSAHKFESRPTIRAVIVDLDDAEAFEAAARANREHGKPLSVGERKSSAKRLLEMRPDWSDRRVADAVGLSPTTVGEVRPRGCPTVQAGQLDTPAKTEGSDGKSRPATKAAQQAQRQDIAERLTAKPDASLREVARQTGTSTMTVAKVRSELKETTEAPRLAAVPPASEEVTVGDVATIYPVPGNWSKHDAFTGSNAARDLARLLDRRSWRDEEDPTTLSASCPAGMRDAVRVAAEENARLWTDLASAVAHTHIQEAK